jgi:hypothetical protein
MNTFVAGSLIGCIALMSICLLTCTLLYIEIIGQVNASKSAPEFPSGEENLLSK